MNLIQVRAEMSVLPAVTAILLHNIATNTRTVCSAVNTDKRGIGCSSCSYCSTVTSQCYGKMY